MKHPIDDIPSIAFQSGVGIRFVGAKVAVFVGRELVCLLRDDIPTIPWPGHWDVLGGGRENDESPWACAQREAEEESGLILQKADVIWGREYVNSRGKNVWFFCAEISPQNARRMVLRDEGRELALKSIDDYLAHPLGVPQFQQRIADWIAGL